MAQETVNIKLSGDDQLTPVLKNIVSAVTDLIGGGNELSTIFSAGLGIGGAVVAANAAVGAFKLVAEGIKELVSKTIEASGEVEHFQLVLASASNSNLDWNGSMAVGAITLKNLQEISKNTGASVDSLVNSQAQLKLITGASSSSITELVGNLAVLGQTSAASAQDMEGVLARALMSPTGNIRLMSAAAIQLSAIIEQQTGQTLQEWILANRNSADIIDKLNTVLIASKERADALADSQGALKQSVSVSTSQVLEQIGKVSGLTDAYKSLLVSLSDIFTQLSKPSPNPSWMNNFSNESIGTVTGYTGAGATETWTNDTGKSNIPKPDDTTAIASAKASAKQLADKLQLDYDKANAVNETQVKLIEIQAQLKKQLDDIAAVDANVWDQTTKNKEAEIARGTAALATANVIDDAWTKEVENGDAHEAQMKKDAEEELAFVLQRQTAYSNSFNTIERLTSAVFKSMAQVSGDYFFQQRTDIQSNLDKNIAAVTKLLDDNKITEAQWSEMITLYQTLAGVQTTSLDKQETSLSGFRILVQNNIDELKKYWTGSLDDVEKMAALETLKASQTAAEIWGAFKAATKATMTQGFNDIFTTALTGGDIKAAFDNLSKNLISNAVKTLQDLLNKIADNFSQYVTAAAEFAYALSQSWGNHNQTTTYNNQNYTGDYGGAAFGKQVAPYLATALAVAVASEWTGVGLVVAAVIALVGVISSLINAPKTVYFPAYGTAMGPNEVGVGGAEYQSYTNTVGSLYDVWRTGEGTSGNSSDFMNYMRGGGVNPNASPADIAAAGYNDEWMRQWTISSAGKNQDDTLNSLKTIVEKLIPQLTIREAFGQTYTGQKTDTAFGVDMHQVPIFVAGSFDPDAPIPKMLEGLGFTAAKIHEIATQIDQRDPQEFLTWLGNLTTVVVTFHAQIKELGQSWSDIQAGWATTAAQSPGDMFKDSANNLITLADDLKNYTGDEQITKAQDLQKATDAYWQSVEQYLQQLKSLQDSLLTSVQNLKDKIAGIYTTTDDTLTAARGRLYATGAGSYADQQANAKNSTDYAASVNAELNDINTILDIDIARLKEATTDLATASGWANKFGSIVQDTTDNGQGYLNLLTSAQKLQWDVASAAKQSGDHQLATLEEVNQSAGDLYNSLLNALQQINQVADSINKSVDAALFQNKLKLETPAEQAQTYQSSIQDLMTQLGSATSADQVNQISQQIQQYISGYESLFSPSDPNYKQAIQWADTVLKQLKATADTQLAALKGVVETAAAAAKKAMDEAQALLQTNVDKTNAEITKLNGILDTLNTSIPDTIGKFATELTNLSQTVLPHLTTALNLFTTAVDTTTNYNPNGGGGPTKDPFKNFNDDINTTTTSLGDLIIAINNTKIALAGN